MEYIEPLTELERIEHALEEAKACARRAFESLGRYDTALQTNSEAPLTSLLTELGAGVLDHFEAREWVALADRIFKKMLEKAENADD